MSHLPGQEPLQPYWYPLALSSELVPGGRPLRQTLLSNPVVLRRSPSGEIRAFLDFCPHRGVPLSAGRVEGDSLQCPYHGWKFDEKGECIEIPGLDREVVRDSSSRKICLRTVAWREVNGVVWGKLGPLKSAEFPVEERPARRLFFKETFPVGLVDLIENFIDPMHTVFVHDGIIRKKASSPRRRKITYLATSDTLRIEHPEQYEEIGPLQRLMNPRRSPVVHHEVIRFPNLLTVSYNYSGGKHDFLAEIMLCPESPTRTVAFVALSFDFGWLTPLARLLVPRFARRVLTQDRQLLELMESNQAAKKAGSGAITYTSIENERHFDEFRRRMANLRNGSRDSDESRGEVDLML